MQNVVCLFACIDCTAQKSSDMCPENDKVPLALLNPAAKLSLSNDY